MRLVCPNCVAQYEVADGTIPETGRDVQCAKCHHIWFQDAAFKLSTDDLIHAPQGLTPPHSDEGREDDNTPGVFHSKRAERGTGEPAERTLPEVGNNILDILRSEAAFSSHRRAAAGESQPEQKPEQEPETLDRAHRAAEGASAFKRPNYGTRAGDVPPPPEPETMEPETPEPEAAEPEEVAEATGDSGAEPETSPRDTGFKRLNWHHLGSSQLDSGWGSTDQDSTAIPDADSEPEQDETDPATAEAEASDDTAAPDEPEMQDAAPEVTASPDPGQAEQANEEFRQTIRRISVRSLAEAASAEEETDQSAPEGDSAQTQETTELGAEISDEEDQSGADTPEPETTAEVADEIQPEEDDATQTELAAETEEEDHEADLSEPDAEPETTEEETAETESSAEDSDTDASEEEEAKDAEETEETEQTSPSFIPIENPDDIRQVRRSLVENRKVLLPDVDELNTSLRMEGSDQDTDLRSSAFKEETAANRSRFWLGLVTALMLFAILSALYLMGPAISDTFPAADPYVVAYRAMVNSALDATAVAWGPVVDWLESL